MKVSRVDASPDGLRSPDPETAPDFAGGDDRGVESSPVVDASVPDVPELRDSPIDLLPLPVIDAGLCRGDAGDLGGSGYVDCPSMVDAGIPVLSCYVYVSGDKIYSAVCGQRLTLRFDMGSHGETCFYEQGSLVGLKMENDTRGFCGGTSFSIEFGSVEECPTSAETLILNCDPFQEAGMWWLRG